MIKKSDDNGYPAPIRKSSPEEHRIDLDETVKWTLIVGFVYVLIGLLFF